MPPPSVVLAGQAYLGAPGGSAIPLGETRYDGSRAALERIAREQYDFDGDVEADKAILGRMAA